MTDLERRKKSLELHRVIGAKMELELKIEECEAEIARIKNHIEVQVKREQELQKELE